MKHLPNIGCPAACAVVLLALHASLAAQDTIRLHDNKTERSESSSGQFVVYGKPWHVRGHFCVLAEEVKTEFLRLLRRRDTRGYPITIVLEPTVGGVASKRPVRSRVSRVEDTFRFHIFVELGDELTMDQVREELIHVLLFEKIVRSADFVKGKRSTLNIPEWLRIGMAGAIKFRKEISKRDSLFASIFESGRMLKIDQILKGRPVDATSVTRALYDASACGLVLTLLDQHNGPERVEALMRDLLVIDGTDFALLKKHFPDLEDSNNSLEKWWALQVATLAEPTVLDVLNVPETEAALQRALLVSVIEDVPAGDDGKKKKKDRKRFFNFGKKKDGEEEPRIGAAEGAAEAGGQWFVTYDLTEFEHFVKHKQIKRMIENCEMKLMQLSYRAFPLYRPLIKEYQDIIQKLAKGRKRGIADRLTELADLRVEMLKTAQDAEDYLHWWEATQTSHESGAFEEYQKLVKELRQRKKKQRDDALSKYLDGLAKEWK